MRRGKPQPPILSEPFMRGRTLLRGAGQHIGPSANADRARSLARARSPIMMHMTEQESAIEVQPVTEASLTPLGQRGARQPVSLNRPVTVLGSKRHAHIRLVSQDVSGAHALVGRTGGKSPLR